MMPSIDQIQSETTKISFDRTISASSELFGALLIKEMSAHFSDLAAPREINKDQLPVKSNSERTRTSLNSDNRLSDNRQDFPAYDSNKPLDNNTRPGDQGRETQIYTQDNDKNFAKTANSQKDEIALVQNNDAGPLAHPVAVTPNSDKNEGIQQTGNRPAVPSELTGSAKSMSENNPPPVALTLINKNNAASTGVIAKASSGSDEYRTNIANKDKSRKDIGITFQNSTKGLIEDANQSQNKQAIKKLNSDPLSLTKQSSTPPTHIFAPKIEKSVANVVAKTSNAAGRNLLQAQQNLEVEPKQNPTKSAVNKQPISNQNFNATTTTSIKNDSFANNTAQTAVTADANPSAKRSGIELSGSNSLQSNVQPNPKLVQNSNPINKGLNNAPDNFDRPGIDKNHNPGILNSSLQKQNLQTNQPLIVGPLERPVENREIKKLSLAARNVGKRSAIHVGHNEIQKSVSFNNQTNFQNINPTLTNNNGPSPSHFPTSIVDLSSNPSAINHNPRNLSLELSSSRNIPVARASTLSSGETIPSTKTDAAPNGGGGNHQLISASPSKRVGDPSPLARAPVSPPTQQVSVQLSKAIKTGDSQIRLQLKPAELGKVEIKLDITADGRAKALILVEKPETLDLLQRDLRTLDRALQDAGLKTDQNSLTFTLNGRENSDAMRHANQDIEQTPDEESLESTSSDRESNESSIPATAIGLTPDGAVNFLA